MVPHGDASEPRTPSISHLATMENVRALLVSAFPVLLAASGLQAQERDPGPGENCSTAEEIAARSEGLTVGQPSEGFHGMRYGGTITVDQIRGDGEPRWSDHPVVRSVYCQSPADSAGVVPGDTILSVNGEDARKARVLAATRPGMEFRLEVQREGEVLEFTVTSVRRPPEARNP